VQTASFWVSGVQRWADLSNNAAGGTISEGGKPHLLRRAGIQGAREMPGRAHIANSSRVTSARPVLAGRPHQTADLSFREVLAGLQSGFTLSD
jgi:hypothetical protein